MMDTSDFKDRFRVFQVSYYNPQMYTTDFEIAIVIPPLQTSGDMISS